MQHQSKELLHPVSIRNYTEFHWYDTGMLVVEVPQSAVNRLVCAGCCQSLAGPGTQLDAAKSREKQSFQSCWP